MNLQSIIKKALKNDIATWFIKEEHYAQLQVAIPSELYKKSVLLEDQKSVEKEISDFISKNAKKICPELFEEYNAYQLKVKQEREEFQQDQDDLLTEIPIEFKGLISSWAWDQGHSSGYAEVLKYVRDYANDLEPVIKTYTENLIKNKSCKKK